MDSAGKVSWVAAVSLAALGLLLLTYPLDSFLSKLSYDWLFRLRPPTAVSQSQSPVVIVYMDDESHEKLEQSGASSWDRRLHAELLRQLKRLGARAVAFDVWFRPPADAAATREMIEAAQDHSQVFFAATRERKAVPSGQRLYWQVIPPDLNLTLPLTYGLVEEADEERTPREHVLPLNGVEPLAWKIARAVMQDPPVPATRRRWVNYYGPSESIPHVSYLSVLSNDFPRSISLSNKVVYVGSGVKTPYTRGIDTDYFRTPYSQKFAGVALNATVFLNLYRGDWLTRVPVLGEAMIVLIVGLLTGRLFSRCSPVWSIPLALLMLLAMVSLAYLLFVHACLWFSWLIPVGVQIPGGLLASLLLANLRLGGEKRILAQRLAQQIPSQSPPAAGVEAPSASATLDQTSTIITPRRSLVIPNYALLRRIGKGAYGEVWLAKNAVGLLHAVKIIHRSAFQNEDPFEREFRGVQSYMPISLGHPGLVPVLYVGRDTEFDCFYYAMELADDEKDGPQINIDRYIPHSLDLNLRQRGFLAAHECIRIALRLSETLDYIHRQKLVHRDIKPSNVIFVRGQPKFADLGLVTGASSERSSSVSAQTALYIGTQGYIPPEGSGTPAADVFSLGKVIYEMALGKDRESFPTLPTDLDQRSDFEDLLRLNPVILRACEPNPENRYRSAQELHRALEELTTR